MIEKCAADGWQVHRKRQQDAEGHPHAKCQEKRHDMHIELFPEGLVKLTRTSGRLNDLPGGPLPIHVQLPGNRGPACSLPGERSSIVVGALPRLEPVITRRFVAVPAQSIHWIASASVVSRARSMRLQQASVNVPSLAGHIKPSENLATTGF